MVEARQLDMGHARALLSLTKSKQLEIASKVVKQDLSVRATESLVKQITHKNKASKPAKKTKDPNIKSLENNLSEKLGARVSINHQANGKGKVEIGYNSLDELDGLLKHIK